MAERLKNCVVGFFLAHAFDAMAVSHACLRGDAKGVNERGLSDAGFSGNEDNLALTGRGLGSHCLKAEDFVVASDEVCERGSCGRDGGCACDGSGSVFDGRDETVSPLGNGLDESGLLCVIVQQLSEIEDVGAQDLWLHIGLWPEGI